MFAPGREISQNIPQRNPMILLACEGDLRYTVREGRTADGEALPMAAAHEWRSIADSGGSQTDSRPRPAAFYKKRENMSSKTDTEVIIGGKVFTLSGYESEEYLQKVASYLNNKLNEYNKVDSFRRQPMDTQGVLLQLNIADDYFKAKAQITELEEELRAREKELYDLKHELISTQIKLESAQEQVKELQQNRSDDAKQIVRLETELKKK